LVAAVGVSDGIGLAGLGAAFLGVEVLSVGTAASKDLAVSSVGSGIVDVAFAADLVLGEVANAVAA